MTAHAPISPAEREAAPAEPAIACGAVLREARERGGMTIDVVAQILKLHPKQVQALEEGRHELLPGRTFVRGFLRNYARALNLDPERLLAMLPDTPPATLASTTHSMGEIRFDSAPKRSWSRWMIPLALVTLVALAAVYEFMRPIGVSPPAESDSSTPRAEEAAPSGAPTNAPGAGAGSGTPLPNPLTPESPRAGDPATAATQDANAASSSNASGGVVSTAIPPSTPGEPLLVIVYGGRSWTEVRDATGKVLLSLTGTPGMTQTVTGTPPFDVTIGSVADVSMRYRGSPVDLSPYRRTNVARLRLD